MSDEKIIQIIPVSVPCWAKYADKNSPNGVFYAPIQCLALVEDSDGFRDVRPMDMFPGDCSFDFPESMSNFLELTYEIPADAAVGSAVAPAGQV